MKKADYPRLKNELTLILPIHQTDAWKLMCVSHQDMSDIVKQMIDEKLIKRTPAKVKGQRTYFIESMSHGYTTKDFSPLLAGQFSPCTGCGLDCQPIYCQKLTSWVMGKP